MKRFMIAIALTLMCAGQVRADVTVVEENIEFYNTVDEFGEYSYEAEQGDYMATVFKSVERNGNTAVWFDYDGTNLSVVSSFVDEGSNWYLVDEGDVFSRETIDSGLFPILFTTDTWEFPGPPVTVGSGDFYLGANSSSHDGPDGPLRNIYSWLHIGNVSGELVRLDGAVAYGGTGIIVGTTEGVVPEPSALALLIVGTLSLLAYGWRRRAA